MAEFKVAADMLGVKVDTSTAAALQDSLRRLREACKDDAAREVRWTLVGQALVGVFV